MENKRKDLIDYMLFTTTYQELAECFEDKEKLTKLWNNVLSTMVDLDSTPLGDYILIKDIPTIDEMLDSKYYNAFFRALNIIKKN